MDNVLMTLNTRIGKKAASQNADRKSIENLTRQIDMYTNSKERKQASIDEKQDEIDLMVTLKIEAEELLKERKSLQAYTDGLVEKFNAIEWKPDLAWEDRIESTDYHEKIAARQAINERLAEIEKEANKIYYRR